MSKFLNWVGWIVIAVGLFISLKLSFNEEAYYINEILREAGFSDLTETRFSPTIFFTYFIGSVLTGLIFLSLGYIIDRIDELASQLKKEE